MSIFSDRLRPGAVLTGRMLRDLLDRSNRPSLLARGHRNDLVQTTINGVTTLTPRQTRSKPIVKPVFGEITFASPVATNKWLYGWREVRFNTSGSIEQAPGGDTGFAVNLAEARNTAATAVYGVVLAVPNVTITVVPIPNLTPIMLTKNSVIGGDPIFSFEAGNALLVSCEP